MGRMFQRINALLQGRCIHPVDIMGKTYGKWITIRVVNGISVIHQEF